MLVTTDAAILMQFSRDVAFLRPALPADRSAPSPDVQNALRVIGEPVVRALRANGHSLPDAVSLIRSVLYTG